MISIENRDYTPNVEELVGYVNTPLFNWLRGYMTREYNANEVIEYSGDKVLLGWNLKYRKAGRTLCTVYPRRDHFLLLLVVGRKEKARVEALMPDMSGSFRRVYESAAEAMRQRWMIFDFDVHTDMFDDVLRVIKIRRNKK